MTLVAYLQNGDLPFEDLCRPSHIREGPCTGSLEKLGFARSHLLGLQLLPRLKGIARQELHRPEIGRPDAYPQLHPVLIQPYSGQASRKSLEIYSQLAIGEAQLAYDGVIPRFPA